MMDLDQEKELVERAKSNAEAFGELYEKYYAPIFGYVLRRTASVTVAQDITSEVFLKALKNLRQFHWRGIPFSSWLYRIASHEIANHYRLNSRQQVSMESNSNSVSFSDPGIESEVLSAEAELEKHEDFLALHRNISQLPSKYQEVIVLRFFEDKQLKEISTILGKREGTVKSLLHRGVEKLREIME